MKTLRHAIFDLREASGSLGDLGTFLPLLVGMTSQNGLDFTAALFFAGFFNVVTGLVFSIPMAVQPMKAIAAVALVQGLTPGQICAAGLMVSLLLLVAASTRGLSVLQDRLPMPVIRGLQMGLGFSLFAKGVELVQRDLTRGWSQWPLFLVGLVLVLVWGQRPARPTALILFLLGCAVVAVQQPLLLQPGFYPPHWCPPGELDFSSSFWSAALPQFPLTVLNSVIGVSVLSFDLFPERGATPRKVALSVALMNLVPACFGGMPMCHGAGGLAGQVRFGARSNGSILMLGVVKMAAALLFGASLLSLCRAYPGSLLGLMLALSALELAQVAYRPGNRGEVTATLITAATTAALQNPLIGLIVGGMFWMGRRAAQE